MTTETMTDEKTLLEQPGQDPGQLFDGRLAAALPEVNAAAVSVDAKEKPESKPPGAQKSASRGSRVAAFDEMGRPFDPAIHETTPDGSPVFRTGKRSKFIKCRGGRPSKTGESMVSPDMEHGSTVGESQAAVEPISPEQQMAQVRAGAAAIAGCQIMLMRVALGNAIAQTEAERSELVVAWTVVFQHYGLGAVHPLVGLAMVSGGIVVGAWHSEETRSRFGKIRDWLERRWLSMWQWFRGRRRHDAGVEGDGEERNGKASA